MEDRRTGERHLCMRLAARVHGVANELSQLSDAECEKIAREADTLLSLFEVMILAARSKTAAD
jgi:hypothetical protein